MNLSKENFYKSDARFQIAPPENEGAPYTIECDVFTYEASNGLYDILIVTAPSSAAGLKMHRKNMGELEHTISNMHPIHYAIEKHFNI